MLHFETMLVPFGKRVLSMHQNGAQDINSRTIVELLDNQTILQTNVIYIGTPKVASGILEGRVRIEPSCYIIIAANHAEPLEFPNQIFTSRAGAAQIYANLASVFNQINQYLLKTFRHSEMTSLSESRNFANFWQAVMDQTMITKEGILTALRSVYPSMSSFIRIITVHFDTPQGQDAYDSMADALHNILPNVCVGRYHDALVVLMSHEERILQSPFTDEQTSQLEHLMADMSASMAYGYSFRNYDKLRTNYMQCERVTILARALHLIDTGRVNSYDRFGMYYLIDLAAQQFIHMVGHSDIIYLIHPAIIQITRYDMANETDLRDTLYYFLLNGNNVYRTASMTYMHRNTVINRINKIKKLTGLDLSDGGLCQRLMFSCQLIQYYERVLNLSLRLDDVSKSKERKGDQK